MTFPKLNAPQQNILLKYLYGLIQMIAICYNFYDDRNKFITKLTQNSYKDLRWLLTFLLPYIDQSQKTMTELTDLSELYTLRYDVISEETKQKIRETKIEDVNFVAPRYVFSNVQYGRYQRPDTDQDSIKTIKFNEMHVRDNYYLLLETIKTTRYKMYINWIDILPYRMDNYNTSRLFIDTRDMIENGTYTIIDPVEDYPIEKVRDINHIQQLHERLKGMNIEDIYNTISINLYDSIVKYKWLLFDVSIRTDTGEIETHSVIQLLNTLFSLVDIMNDADWSSGINESARDRFSREWDRFLSGYEKNLEMASSTKNINANAIKTIAKSFIVFFDKKYSKINALLHEKQKKYIPLSRKNIIDDVDDYDERMRDVSNTMALKSLKSIEYVYAYDFLLESIQGLKTTWYAMYIMNETKTQILPVAGYAIENKVTVTFKNIYNFCKSFVHERRNIKPPAPKKPGEREPELLYSQEYARLPRFWSELDDRCKNLILNRLVDTANSWFDIRNNMFHVMKSGDQSIKKNTIMPKILADMDVIYKKIKRDLASILFETLILTGTMSYIVAENDLTNNAIYDLTQPEHKKSFVSSVASKRFYKGHPYGSNCYYYLTNKLYKDTGSYFIKVDDAPEEYDYFKICSTVKTAWYLSTTFHWIAQLGFCHRFLNNRVNFVTGGTGAGKSTQVPKMYLYYLKAIEKIPDPTVIITVPRTNVATGVSNFVSQELALPFQEVDRVTKQDNKVKNDNYTVQFKYMKEEHLNDGSYPKIRFITDGSVLQDAKDPLMKPKKIIKSKRKTKADETDETEDTDESDETDEDNYVHTRNDKYNVVIIDEAHEHNANMDMILTLMRNATYYNNKLRLVIMSATMDADEPVYRRFYRMINDNRKYPLNRSLVKHSIDRINTERRFHISPPDETTRFKITEYYSPGEDANEIVIKIINNTSTGDILLFRPGTKDISDSLSVLNAPGVLPDDVIALPYHAQLPDHVREFTDKIDKNLKNLRIKKSQDISTVSRERLITGDTYYSRCVLVATNIAEASISIGTLRYVVETGLEKTMKFNFESRSNVLYTNYITEASRLQRKGRVGRVAPGTVYYTYKKGSLEKNTKQFNISVQDISHTLLLDLVKDPNDIPLFTELIEAIVSGRKIREALDNIIKNSEKSLVSQLQLVQNTNAITLNNPNLTLLIKESYEQHFKKYINDENKKYYSSKWKKEFLKSITEIIFDHYLADGALYEYYGNDVQNDYKNDDKPASVYLSGFDVQQLADDKGKFYIVHPDELSIKRNIAGDIVESDGYAVIINPIKSLISNSVYKHAMTSNKMLVFWETLINNGFISFKKIIGGDTGDGMTMFRTKMGDFLTYCSAGLTVFKDASLIKMLFYGYGLSKSDEEFERVLNIVSALNVIAPEAVTKKMIDNEAIDILNKGNDDDPRARKLLENKFRTQLALNFSGDQMIKSDLDILENIITLTSNVFKGARIEYNTFKSNYFKKGTFFGENIVGIEKGIPINSEKRTLKLSKKDMTYRNAMLTRITDLHKTDLAKFLDTQRQLMYNMRISPEVVRNIVVGREDLRRVWNDIVYDVKNVGEQKKTDISELRTLMKAYRDMIDGYGIDLIKATMMLSKPYDVKRKISNTSQSYISVYNPHLSTITILPETSTFVNPPYYQEYVLNLSENLEFETIGNIVSIDSYDLRLLANVYNPREMRRKLSDARIDTTSISAYGEEYIAKKYSEEQNNFIIQTAESQSKSKSKSKPQFDFRNLIVPERQIAVTNMRKTVDLIRSDMNIINTSRVFSVLEKMGQNYADYRKLLTNF
jgi:hypothetical protein